MHLLRCGVLTVSIVVAGGGVASLALADDPDPAQQSPADLITAAQAALGKVQNLRASGTELDRGDPTTKIAGTFTASGPADVSVGAGGVKARLIVVPKAVYIKGNAPYWKSISKKSERSLAGKLANKWIKLPADAGQDATSEFNDLSPKHIASCLGSHAGTLSNKGVKTVDGRDVVVIEDAGDKPGSAPGQLWIDVKTKLPVREVQTGPAKAGGKKDSACDDDWPSTTQKSDMKLSRFGKAPKVKAPKRAVSIRQAVGDGGGGSTDV